MPKTLKISDEEKLFKQFKDAKDSKLLKRVSNESNCLSKLQNVRIECNTQFPNMSIEERKCPNCQKLAKEFRKILELVKQLKQEREDMRQQTQLLMVNFSYILQLASENIEKKVLQKSQNLVSKFQIQRKQLQDELMKISKKYEQLLNSNQEAKVKKIQAAISSTDCDSISVKSITSEDTDSLESCLSQKKISLANSANLRSKFSEADEIDGLKARVSQIKKRLQNF